MSPPGGEFDRAAPYARRVARPATIFSCSACGTQSPKWHGRCPGCGEWNTLVEERAPAPGAAGARGGRAGGLGGPGAAAAGKAVPLRDVRVERTPRLHTGIGELDR